MSQTWMWFLWALLIVVGFALIESYAFRHEERQHTLSYTVWNMGKKWPMTLVLFGFVFGVASAHFFWNWCPVLN